SPPRLLLLGSAAIVYGATYPHSASLRSAPLPLKRGEEGCQARGRRFLSPVDRGVRRTGETRGSPRNGGLRSKPEWGSNSMRRPRAAARTPPRSAARIDPPLKGEGERRDS